MIYKFDVFPMKACLCCLGSTVMLNIQSSITGVWVFCSFLLILSSATFRPVQLFSSFPKPQTQQESCQMRIKQRRRPHSQLNHIPDKCGNNILECSKKIENMPFSLTFKFNRFNVFNVINLTTAPTNDVATIFLKCILQPLFPYLQEWSVQESLPSNCNHGEWVNCPCLLSSELLPCGFRLHVSRPLELQS